MKFRVFERKRVVKIISESRSMCQEVADGDLVFRFLQDWLVIYLYKNPKLINKFPRKEKVKGKYLHQSR
jgi:hypothetical protein